VISARSYPTPHTEFPGSMSTEQQKSCREHSWEPILLEMGPDQRRELSEIAQWLEDLIAQRAAADERATIATVCTTC